jgi:hypothetical protein
MRTLRLAKDQGDVAMNETYWTDTPASEETETAAASDSAATFAKGAMFTNDDTTDDPGVASNGEPLDARTSDESSDKRSVSDQLSS